MDRTEDQNDQLEPQAGPSQEASTMVNNEYSKQPDISTSQQQNSTQVETKKSKISLNLIGSFLFINAVIIALIILILYIIARLDEKEKLKKYYPNFLQWTYDGNGRTFTTDIELSPMQLATMRYENIEKADTPESLIAATDNIEAAVDYSESIRPRAVSNYLGQRPIKNEDTLFADTHSIPSDVIFDIRTNTYEEYPQS